MDRVDWSTFIDVIANEAVTLESIVTSARVASRVVGTSCICVTNSWDKSTLVIICTETVCSISGIAGFTCTIPTRNLVKAESICIAIMNVDHISTFVNVGAVGRIAGSCISVSPVAIAVETAVSISASCICMAIVRKIY